jgi:tight adherence protein C
LLEANSSVSSSFPLSRGSLDYLLGGLLHRTLPVAAAVLGLLMPNIIVRRLRESYVRNVERGLPDALDMMVICAEAGLGLTATIGRVGAEIRPAHPAVSDELLLTANELNVAADTRIALTNLGNRTGLPALKQLGGALIQSQHYGTPLGEALRALAAEMRQIMLTRFEERAAKLPALLTVPMILFILPATFIVVGGPALIQVLRIMSH